MGRIGQFMKDAGRRRVLSNAAIYIVAAWVAIQVADLAIDAGVLRWALRDVFVAAFLGFPVALIISWFYDVTRRGIVRTPPVGADASFCNSLRKRDYLLIVSLVTAWAVAIVVVHTPAPVDKSIAILPFENPGHDPDNAMFAFGIRADLQTQLQNLHDLKIIASDSSDRIDSDMSLPEIGLRLGASYIMKGSVERVLDRVHVNVILIDAEKDQQTWAGSYDRELTASNWFDIRNEISGVITNKLQAELSPTEKKRLEILPTESFAAHKAFLFGKQRMRRRTTGALAEAIEYFQQAIDLDPEFALAWVGLADSYYLHMLYAATPEDEAYSNMKAAINQALKLDDQLGEAYATLGVFHSMKNGDKAAGEMAFKRALELSPNYATAHQWYGATLVTLGRAEEGLAQKKRAQELDPLSPNVNMSLGMTLDRFGRFDEAMSHYKTAIESDPAFPGAYERIGDIYRFVFGQLDEAVAWQRKGIALDPGEPWGSIFLGFIYLDLGDSEQAEHWFKRAAELVPQFPMSGMLMEPVHMFRSEEAKSLEYARRNIKFEPGGVYTLANLRNHDLREGRYAEARARYERGYPELLGEAEPTIDDSNFEAAIDLALVLIKMGEQERADLLLDRTSIFIGTIPRLGETGYGISDVRIHALRENTEAALAALRVAIDERWRNIWWFYLEHDPGLDSIRDEPEFQAMLKEIKDDMAVQLAHVRSMEANGELAPIPDIK